MMQILVTGGTGVIGKGLIPELLASGHGVRLLSRSASEQQEEWPDGVECRDGDVTQPATLQDACRGCDAVIHITGIVDEQPPDITFERVNVEGTRQIVKLAERSGIRRLVFVSSLGADRGKSPYHQSKRQAEKLVEQSTTDWVIVRPGHVFGPGDEMISTVLKMVRTSPIVPKVGFGQHRFQPVWFKDFGKALTACVEREELSRQTIEVAGGEVITVSELMKQLSELTDRPAWPLPLPAFLVRGAVWGFSLVRRFLPRGASLPLNESKLTMLIEENRIQDGRPNGMFHILRLRGTPLQLALRELTQTLPANPPENGVGSLERKRFWIDLAGARQSAAELMTIFKKRITEVMPIDFSAEPASPREVEYGATLSASLPGRGHIQVRVEQCDPERVTFVTVEGHPLAGVVTFYAESAGDRLRFTVETFARPANAVDWVAINLAGRWFQDLTWQQVAANMGRLSGAETGDGVQQKAVTLDEQETRQVEDWAHQLIASQQREQVEEEVAASR